MRKQNYPLAYIRWIFQQYQTLKQAERPGITYRLVRVEEQAEACTLTIQVVGKAVTLTATPREVLADDAWVEHFSSKDIRTITYYATKALEKPKHKIVTQRFSAKLKQFLFGVKRGGEDTVIEKTAAEISLDESLLHTLSPEEAHRVGYTTAQEKQDQEKASLQILREENARGKQKNI